MMNADRVIDFLIAHRTLGVALIALWAFVTLCVIARLWVVHRRECVLTKLVWSLVLLIPLFGLLFFAAFYRTPEGLDWTGQVEHGRDAPYGGGGHV